MDATIRLKNNAPPKVMVDEIKYRDSGTGVTIDATKLLFTNLVTTSGVTGQLLRVDVASNLPTGCHLLAVVAT